jgi:hypothetical protein
MTSPLLINEPPLQILPSLAKVVGLNEAIVLQQVHYWLNPHFNSNFFEERHWVHNTLTQWQKQFVFWSRKTIKRTIANLEESGLLISFVTRGFKKTKYYTLDYDLLRRINLSKAHHTHPAQTRAEYDPGYDTGHEAGDDAEDNCQHSAENPPVNQSNQSSQQKLLMDWPECTDQSEQEKKMKLAQTHLKLEETAEKQGSHSWGQNDPLDGAKMTLSMGSKCPSRWGQNDPLDGVNLTPSLNTETTSENTLENTSPPLPLSCPSSARSNPSKVDSQPKPEPDEPQEDEEENKKIKILEQQPYQQMVDFWNQSVQSKIYVGQEVRLTEKRKELLDAFLETVLEDKFPSEKHRNAKLDGWQHYCSLIAQSKFLAGNNSSGFKATLDWALVPGNAYKVLEGIIYDKPEPVCRPKDQSWETFSEELARTLPSGQYLQPWLKISVNLAKMIGQVRYRSWFAKVSLEELSETNATFSIEGNFMRDYITTHFLTDLRHAIRVLYPRVTQIDFRTRPLEGGVY